MGDEGSRIEALREHEILDTPPEVAFDRVASLAARLFDAPIALVSLVDEDRQWFKARVGLDVAETPREYAFCAHAIQGADTLVVPDASLDARFASNPLVTGAPGIRFYAGHPLVTPDGHALGTLCVIDRVPRELDDAQLELLALLAGQAQLELELRRAGLGERDARRALDRSERRLLEVQQLDRYRALAEDGPTATIIHVDGVIRFANQAAADLHGFARAEDLVGRRVVETLPSGRRAAFASRVAEVLAGVALEDQRRPFLRADGTEGMASVHARRIDWEGTVAVRAELTDVTERASAEEALQLAEERFRLVQHHAPVGLAVVEPDGRFSSVNDELCRIVGRSVAELLRCSFQDITHPDDLDADLHLLDRLATGEIDDYELEKRYVRPDGAQVPTLLRRSVVRHDGGAPAFYIACILDLTDRRQAEQERLEHMRELAAINEELEHAVALKDRVLATASHDLRTPLTAILGFSSTLLQFGDGLEPSEREAALIAIVRQAKRLDRLVDDLLSLGVLEGGSAPLDLVDVYLPDLVAEVVADSALPFEVEVDLPVGLRAHADPHRLTQVLGNLLTNVARYGAGPVTITGSTDGDWTDLRVRDCGPGVAADFVPHLFDSFATAPRPGERKAPGTGLGLAIVRAITLAHGGDAWFEHNVPTGACFAVRLPARARSATAPLRGPDASIDARPGQVLVAHGARWPVDGIARHLREAGYEVVLVDDGLRALTAVRTQRPAILIADADLPGIDGFELVSRLRIDTHTADIPVLLTTSAGGEEIERALALGADDCLHQDLRPDELVVRVRNALLLAERAASLRLRRDDLEQASITDPLLGIANRRGLDAHIARMGAFASRHHESVGVLMVDVDHFKTVNDRHGHSVGDAALAHIAATIAAQMRIEDIVGRWGGEEFLVLLPGEDIDGAADVAGRIRAAVAHAPFHHDGVVLLAATVSIGVTATSLVDGVDISGAIRRADAALYAAKAGGRDTVRVLA